MTQKEYNSAIDDYADNLFRFVVKQMRNRSLAEDVVQETFAKVWEKHENIQFEKVKSYLFTTAYHTMIDVLKKESKSGSIDGFEHTIAGQADAEMDLSDVLNEALNRLPEIQKTVVLLRDYEGYNYNEIAEITQLNESQVKVYIFRARQALKLYIKRMELVV